MSDTLDERVSNSAIWCQRLAVFLLPYFLQVIILFRFNKIEAVQLLALVGIGLIISLIAAILAIRAAGDLWTKGYRGGSRVVRGTLLAMLVLMPFLYFAFLAVQLPLANDVSTAPFDPPPYIAAVKYRAERSDSGMNPVLEYTADYASDIVTAYPKLQSRRYPAGPERVLEAVTAIIQENEWPITASLGVPQTAAGLESEETTTTESEAQLADNEPETSDIYIEYVERTLVFGFENDVVVRIVSEDQNTLVDLRASSRWGRHDFGYNAKLIDRFLEALDTTLLGIAGEG